MTVDELQELQAKLENNQPLSVAQCVALVAEIWRLKNLITGKTMEARGTHDELRELRVALDRAQQENGVLRGEVEEFKSVHELSACPLEQRWSNCAVRTRKRAIDAARNACAKR